MIILLTMQSLLGLLNIIVFVLATTYEGTDFCYKFNLWAGATLGVFWLLAYCPSLPLIVWYCRKHDSRRRRRDKTDFREEQELPLSVL